MTRSLSKTICLGITRRWSATPRTSDWKAEHGQVSGDLFSLVMRVIGSGIGGCLMGMAADTVFNSEVCGDVAVAVSVVAYWLSWGRVAVRRDK